jgi:hypothetical protein
MMMMMIVFPMFFVLIVVHIFGGSLHFLCLSWLFLSGSPPWVYLNMGRLRGEPRAAAQNSGFGACVLGWGSPVKNRSLLLSKTTDHILECTYQVLGRKTCQKELLETT